MLDWINDIIQALLSLVPRPLIVPATHGGIKWVRGSIIRELEPGFHWWWPLTTKVSLIAIARQSLNTPTQALMTSDCREVVAGGVVVYSINNVVRAIGKRNWDVDDTVNNITQAAVVKVITQHTLDNLLPNLCGDIEKRLTRICRKELRQFGVYVHRAAMTDFSTCKAYNILGTHSGTPVVDDELSYVED